MLSPVLNRIPWTTDVMQVLEHLDLKQRNGVCFTLCCYPVSPKIFTNAQEIISNILFYEKRYLLNGGISMNLAEMQDLLGIQFKQVGSRYRFTAKPAPTWNHVQASKVCNLICTYKLAEIVSIDNDSVQFQTISN